MIGTEKILVTGSNGMLGKDIVQILKIKDKYDVYGINRNHDNNLSEGKSIVCDITNLKELRKIVEEIKPNIIIHCAAIVDVDACEEKKDYADKLNIESTRQLVTYKCESTKFVYISTDSVFDGEHGGYNEESLKNPINYYAKTKSIAEEIVQSVNPNSIIIRTNIYGFHKQEGKSLVEWALDELLGKREIFGFNDVYFNPVYTKQLARVIIDLLKINYSGIIHVASDKELSKYDFLRRLAYKFDLGPELVNSISFNEVYFKAKRPKNTSLEAYKIKKLYSEVLNIDDGLNELWKDYLERGNK